MSKTVTIADFDLHWVKLTKKGLNVIYFDKQNPNHKVKKECDGLAHPDLKEKFEDVVGKEIMATSLQLLEGWNFAREHNRKNEEALQEARRKWSEEVLRCEVREVFFVGEDETAGISFKGVLDCGGLLAKVDVPAFTYEEAEEDIEGRAEAYAENLKKEVWSYLFKGKKAQTKLDLDGDSEEEKEKPKSGLNA